MTLPLTFAHKGSRRFLAKTHCLHEAVNRLLLRNRSDNSGAPFIFGVICRVVVSRSSTHQLCSTTNLVSYLTQPHKVKLHACELSLVGRSKRSYTKNYSRKENETSCHDGFPMAQRCVLGLMPRELFHSVVYNCLSNIAFSVYVCLSLSLTPRQTLLIVKYRQLCALHSQ